VAAAALLHVFDVSEGAEAAARRARGALQRLRFSNAVADGAAALVRAHGCLLSPGRPLPPRAGAPTRRWLADVGRERLGPVLALWRVDADAQAAAARQRSLRALKAFRPRALAVARSGAPLSIAELAVDGRAVMSFLGAPAGPEVGEALRHLLERVLEDPRLNTADRLASELRTWRAGHAS
jgi:tRNA nucleotidyltransferase (CCA-adding enzyme)